jgi:hypothetical protein
MVPYPFGPPLNKKKGKKKTKCVFEEEIIEDN